MSVKPKLLCPPDYSILALRFTECKKLGVVKGITTMFAFDLSNFFIPLTNYAEVKFTVKSGKKKKLDIGGIASFSELNETYQFIYTDAGVADGTSHIFTIYDEDSLQLEQITFTVDALVDAYADFPTAFATELAANVDLTALITAEYNVNELSEVTVSADAKGIKYKYLLEYDSTGAATGPYEHPGNLIQQDYKYPEGRVRAIFLYADYARVDSKTCSCNCCADPSGDLLSNVKNFEWSWNNDYTKKQVGANLTGIIVNADAADAGQQNLDGTQTFQWLNTGNSAAYYLKVGDMVTIDAITDNPYTFVTAIDGFNITVDKQGVGTGTGTDQLITKFAPEAIDWKTAGEILFISGGQDVYDANYFYTDTVWIRNTQNYDIPFVAIIVS